MLPQCVLKAVSLFDTLSVKLIELQPDCLNEGEIRHVETEPNKTVFFCNKNVYGISTALWCMVLFLFSYALIGCTHSTISVGVATRIKVDSEAAGSISQVGSFEWAFGEVTYTVSKVPELPRRNSTPSDSTTLLVGVYGTFPQKMDRQTVREEWERQLNAILKPLQPLTLDMLDDIGVSYLAKN